MCPKFLIGKLGSSNGSICINVRHRLLLGKALCGLAIMLQPAMHSLHARVNGAAAVTLSMQQQSMLLAANCNHGSISILKP